MLTHQVPGGKGVEVAWAQQHMRQVKGLSKWDYEKDSSEINLQVTCGVRWEVAEGGSLKNMFYKEMRESALKTAESYQEVEGD